MKFLRKYVLYVLILSILFPALRAAAAEAAPIRDGDRVVIYVPEKGEALSSVKSRQFNRSVNVTLTEGTMTGYGETEVWTVEETAEGWRFLNGSQALSLVSGYTDLRLDGEDDGWILESAGEGTYRIKNATRQRYLYWESGRDHWTTFTSGTAVAFYVLPREESDTPEAGVYRLYFGQLHAHTDLSDGTGTVEEAFAYASQVEGLDFFAVTEHSQSLDNAQNGALSTDGASISQEWARGKAAAAAVTDETFVGIFAFEMTWNQGQGHMSTFNTPGFLSREQDAYQSYDSGMEAYYAALLEAEHSVSQFNHPGDTHGDFKNFTGYSPAIDQRITLIEVGESWEYYDQALAKGWHLAPTNNQNNHSGHWGDESPVRTVVLAESLTEEGLYDAMANYRVYATEDSDLEIVYTLNGYLMGSEIPLREVGDAVTLSAELRDPTDSAIGTVAVITEGGRVLAQQMVSAPQETVNFTLPTDRAYYYLRITQTDGDVALTAPIWLDEQKDMGISALKTASEVTTAGEAQRILLEICNYEKSPLEITSVTLTAEGTRYADTSIAAVEPFGTASWAFTHTFETDGVYTVTANVEGIFNGEARSFAQTLQITVMPPPLVDDVLVDGTHGSGESLQNIMALAKNQDVDMRMEAGEITAQMLKTCRLLIIPTPAADFEDTFVKIVSDYVLQGGNVILCGTSNSRDPHGAARLNGLLQAMGVSLRINADEARDDMNNGGTGEQLYTTVFAESKFLEGLAEGQFFVQNDGCSVAVNDGAWLVKGFATAEDAVLLAVEETPYGGSVFAAGCTFLSDDYVDGETERVWAQPLANQTIMENILGLTRTIQETIPISDLRGAQTGRIYLAEGRVTAGTANPNTAFTDTIYIQDDTGGIAAMPYSARGLALGTRVRILGALGSEGGNPCLQLVRMEILGEESVIAPEEAENSVTYAQKGGQLLKLQGTVVSASYTADHVGVFLFTVEDEAGNRADILVEENIVSGSRAKNELARIVKTGNQVSAVGLLHLENGKTVLRLRDCDEVILLWSPEPESTEPGTEEDPTETPTEAPDSPGEETGGESPDDDFPEIDINPNTGDRGIQGYVLLAAASLLGMLALAAKRKGIISEW